MAQDSEKPSSRSKGKGRAKDDRDVDMDGTAEDPDVDMHDTQEKTRKMRRRISRVSYVCFMSIDTNSVIQNSMNDDTIPGNRPTRTGMGGQVRACFYPLLSNSSIL